MRTQSQLEIEKMNAEHDNSFTKVSYNSDVSSLQQRLDAMV